MNEDCKIDIGRDFNRFPAGRYKRISNASGEEFRDRFLIPALESEQPKVAICLDSTIGYGSSFLEEAFGGLVRSGYAKSAIINKFELITDDLALKDEILSYINDAE